MSNLWTFKGVTFKRLGPGDSDTQWFPIGLNVTVEVAAGATSPGARWVDVGGWEVAPLAMTAAQVSAADAATLISYRGSIGTLAAVGGQSGQALLKKADILIADGGPFVRVALEFEFVQ